MIWKLAVFDWDGTLVDSREIAYRATCDIFRHYGVEEPPSREAYFRDQISDFIPFYHRHGIPASVNRNELNGLWRRLFFAESNHPPLREGTLDMLRACREAGLRTAIVSGNIPEVIQACSGLLGLGGLIDHVHANANGKTEELRAVLAHFGIGPEEAFYLDDTAEGLLAASRAGMAAIGIEGGFNLREHLETANPDHIIAEPAGLPALLVSLEISR